MSSHGTSSTYLEARKNWLYARRERLFEVETKIKQLRKRPPVGIKEIDDNIEFEIDQLVKVREDLHSN